MNGWLVLDRMVKWCYFVARLIERLNETKAQGIVGWMGRLKTLKFTFIFLCSEFLMFLNPNTFEYLTARKIVHFVISDEKLNFSVLVLSLSKRDGAE